MSQPAAPPASLEPLGYPELNLGLNNQKMALFGLFCKAAALQRPIILPGFSNFDAKFGQHSTVPLDQVYKVDVLRRFAAAFDRPIIDAPPLPDVEGWHCFIAGADRIGRDAIRGTPMLDDFTCQFFRHLAPRICDTAVFKKLASAVFGQGRIKLVAHLRIEGDWMAHTADIKSKAAGQDDVAPSAAEIIGKIKNTIPYESETIYVVCDEANLPAPKDEIRAEIRHRFGVSLVWKTDILTPEELAPLSVLDLSIIDFEMSIRAPIFAGVSHSAFSNMVNFEWFCRQGRPAPEHYIFNFPGDRLARRWDNGAMVDPLRNTSKIFRREKLIADSPADCLWPAQLTTHIAEFGDFTTETSSIPGVRRGHLVGGFRGSLIHAIEGFAINQLGGFDLPLEYRACLSDGTWTSWFAPGAYAGTRGEKQALRGFAARLTGRLALSYECVCAGSFTDHFNLVETTGGADCVARDGARLEAMQIVFRAIPPSRLWGAVPPIE